MLNAPKSVRSSGPIGARELTDAATYALHASQLPRFISPDMSTKRQPSCKSRLTFWSIGIHIIWTYFISNVVICQRAASYQFLHID